MEKIPEQINTSYLAQMQPAAQAAIVVAQTVNRLIRWLQANEAKITSLPDFSKDIREQS